MEFRLLDMELFFLQFFWGFTERSEIKQKNNKEKTNIQFNMSLPAPDYVCTASNSFDCSISKSIINCSIIKRVAVGASCVHKIIDFSYSIRMLSILFHN